MPNINKLSEEEERESRNRVIRIGIYAVLGFIILFLIFGSGSAPKEKPQQDVKRNSERGKVMREGFIEGCTEGGGNYEFCKCTYDELDARHTEEEIIDMSIHFQKTGEMPSSFWDAAEKCIHLLPEDFYEQKRIN